jgi:hypothetical protein
MHVLDAIMVPLKEVNSTASGTPSPTASATESGSTATGAADVVYAKPGDWAAWTVLGLAVVLGMDL